MTSKYFPATEPMISGWPDTLMVGDDLRGPPAAWAKCINADGAEVEIGQTIYTCRGMPVTFYGANLDGTIKIGKGWLRALPDDFDGLTVITG